MRRIKWIVEHAKGTDDEKIEPMTAEDRVVSPCAGTVVAVARAQREGSREANEVHLARADGLVVVVSHLRADSVRVRLGDAVARGDVLGRMGMNGQSGGLHVHVEVRRVRWAGRRSGERGWETVPFGVRGHVPRTGDRVQGVGGGA